MRAKPIRLLDILCWATCDVSYAQSLTSCEEVYMALASFEDSVREQRRHDLEVGLSVCGLPPTGLQTPRRASYPDPPSENSF